ncbi:hypothetical protein Y032_0022g656 [Ancylostoma ceylanicum]|uniref:Uncharacterized protein n=1 Tax=Ancylostoma ceylanicum TaxID=53326 RepID=A0A016UYJ5_9BILA|nr:hypothetical protein Y032_0022g656 [Ancylostoma ceylanicum]
MQEGTSIHRSVSTIVKRSSFSSGENNTKNEVTRSLRRLSSLPADFCCSICMNIFTKARSEFHPFIVVVTAFPTSAAADNGHGATRPPCNTAAKLLRGAGLSIDFFLQTTFSAFLFISARIFTFATHFFEFSPQSSQGEMSEPLVRSYPELFRVVQTVFDYLFRNVLFYGSPERGCGHSVTCTICHNELTEMGGKRENSS